MGNSCSLEEMTSQLSSGALRRSSPNCPQRLLNVSAWPGRVLTNCLTFSNLTPFLGGFRTRLCEFYFGQRYFYGITALGRGGPKRGNVECYGQVGGKAAINGNHSICLDLSYI